MPSFLSGKKLILLGFIIVLLVAIPLTVYLVQQQQKTKSSAVQATIVSFVPSTKSVNVNEAFSLDVNVDPGGVNQISFVKLLIMYDATKISTADAGLVVQSWKAADGTNFTPSVLQGPTYGPGTIALTISVGQSPQNVIQKPTKIATINFQAIAPTDTAPTQIQFGNQTQVLSIGSTDQFNENVLSNAPPANITIAGAAVTPTQAVQSNLSCNLSSDTTSVAAGGVAHLTTTCQESSGTFDANSANYTWSATCGTIPAGNSPGNTWTAPSSGGPCTVAVKVCDTNGNCSSPSVDISLQSVAATPTTGAGATATPTDTPTPTPTTTTQTSTVTTPTCSSLVLDKAANGTIPYNLNFTANGASSNSTISSVTFNFGDGQTQTITSTGGIGTNAVSVLQSHVYNTAGTFTATATLTDANGNVSPVGACSATITITQPQVVTTNTNPSPLPPTGPSQLVTIGAIGAVLTVIGALLLFAL